MDQQSEDEKALIKIQNEWAEARIKGDSSYTRRLEAEDCTIVWPDGRIVSKSADLQTMTGDIVFSEFKINDLRVRLYGDTGIVVGEWHHQRAKRDSGSSPRKIRLDRYICKTKRPMEGGRIADNSGLGKIIASRYA